MKKNRHYLSILLVVPFLMGNSPAPAPRVVYYHNLSMKVVSSEPYNDKYKNEYEVTNTGSNYLIGYYDDDYSTIALMLADEDENQNKLLICDKQNHLFSNQVLGPGQTMSFKSTDDLSFDKDSMHAVRGYCYYQENESFETSNSRIFLSNDDYCFTCDTAYEGSTADISNYAIFVDIIYDEHSYSIAFQPNRDHYFTVTSYININKLTIARVRYFLAADPGNGRKNNYTRDPNSTILTLAIVFTSISIILVLAGMIIAIIIQTKQNKKRNLK